MTIPIPAHFHLHFDIGDILCNCGACCAQAPTTSVISKNLEPTTPETQRLPRNLRLVADRDDQNLRIKSTWRSRAGLKSAAAENRRTIKAYYGGLVSDIKDRMGIPAEDIALGRLCAHVLAARKGVNLHDRYRKGQPLRVHDVARVSRSMRKVHPFTPFLRELLERLASYENRAAIETGGEEQTPGAESPAHSFSLKCFSDDELCKVREKITRILQVPEAVWWQGCCPPTFTVEEANKVIKVAEEACQCAACQDGQISN